MVKNNKINLSVYLGNNTIYYHIKKNLYENYTDAITGNFILYAIG